MKFAQVKNKANKFLAANELRAALETLQGVFLPTGIAFQKVSRTEIKGILDDSWNLLAELMTKYTIDQEPQLHKDILALLNKLALNYIRHGFAKEARDAYQNIANIEENSADILSEQLKGINPTAYSQHASDIVDYYKEALVHYQLAKLSKVELNEKTFSINISLLQMQEDLLKLQINTKQIPAAFQTADDMNDHYCATIYRDYQEMVTKTKILTAQYKGCTKQQKKQFSKKELNFDPAILKRNAEGMDYLVAAYRQLLVYSKNKPEVLAKARYFAQQIYNMQIELYQLQQEGIIQEKDTVLPGDCKEAMAFYYTQSLAPQADSLAMISLLTAASSGHSNGLQKSGATEDENSDSEMALEDSNDSSVLLFSAAGQKAGSGSENDLDDAKDSKAERSDRKVSKEKKHTPSHRDKRPY